MHVDGVCEPLPLVQVAAAPAARAAAAAASIAVAAPAAAARGGPRADEGVPQLRLGVLELEDGALRNGLCDVPLGTELEAGAALGEAVVEALLAPLAAGAGLSGLRLALARLEQRALGHDRRADGLVAGGHGGRREQRRQERDQRQ